MPELERKAQTWVAKKAPVFSANRVFWDISQRPAAFQNRNPFMQNPLRGSDGRPLNAVKYPGYNLWIGGAVLIGL
ncbi:MAG: hypothetical protein U9Q79_04525 [Candidatus Hydrogenedentes bacterium]|nr:hypothetical protein [Candidatus Hydrogenedentota bacterium]